MLPKQEWHPQQLIDDKVMVKEKWTSGKAIKTTNVKIQSSPSRSDPKTGISMPTADADSKGKIHVLDLNKKLQHIHQ